MSSNDSPIHRTVPLRVGMEVRWGDTIYKYVGPFPWPDNPLNDRGPFAVISRDPRGEDIAAVAVAALTTLDGRLVCLPSRSKATERIYDV